MTDETSDDIFDDADALDTRPKVSHNVGHWPTRWAARCGDRPAVSDGAHDLDWSTFDIRIAGLAGWLSEQGIARGDRIGILLLNRVAYLELVFASARIGAICLPINLRLAPREIAFLLDDARPTALFYESSDEAKLRAACEYASHIPPHLVAVGGSQGDGQDDEYEAALRAAPPRTDALPVPPDEPMMLMYTSGTTGQPKGALLPHRKALYNSLNAEIYFDIRPEDRVLVVAPLFHSLGLQILALPLLYCGGSLVLQRRFDAACVWQTVERERISYFGGVPTLHQRLHDALSHAPAADCDLSSLRFVFTAGSAVSVELIRAFEARGLVLKQGYGQTETSILCCLDAGDAIRKAGSVGLPVRHLELRIVKDECRALPPSGWRDAAPGETGEIVVRGPITMLGYWQQPEASRETLVDGWVWTGDLAVRDDAGYVTLVGRSREMIISGGENVYPAEVEAAYREHPAIREIAVVGVADPEWGEVGRAHVVLQAGQRFDEVALDAWARERLARFKIPRSFVIEKGLPHTASGKVQKHRLRSP